MRSRKTSEVRQALGYFAKQNDLEFIELNGQNGRHASWSLITRDGQKVYDATINVANGDQSRGAQRDMIYRAKRYANLEGSGSTLGRLRKEFAKYLQDQFDE